MNSKKTAILIDWLVQVSQAYEIIDLALHVSVALTYIYLAKTTEQITNANLQLIGVTALMIATKLEDVEYMTPRECTVICDEGYDVQTVVQCERQFLKVLDYRIKPPTAYPFLMRFLVISQAT